MQSKSDAGWVRQQLTAAGYDSTYSERSSIANSVELLLRELDSQGHPHDESRRTTVELFSRLALGQSIAPLDPQGRGRSWRAFQLGDVIPGATVRVRDDAYATRPYAERHNGKLGRFVAARGGDAVVQYDGSSDTTGHRHSPAVLEVLE